MTEMKIISRGLKSKITNRVHEDITMDNDHPARNEDSKLPILDMKVLMDVNGYKIYHYGCKIY